MSVLSARPAKGEHDEEIPAAALRDRAAERAAAGQRLMTMVGRDAGDAVELLVAFDAGEQIDVLRAALPLAAPRYPALTPALPAAAWYERELADLLGVEPEGHPDPRPLLLPRNWPVGAYPLRKGFDPSAVGDIDLRDRPTVPVAGPGVFTIPYGPVRSGVFETTQFVVATAGEDLLHVDQQIGYKHRGVEKRF